jgi:hypothetical protein
VSGYQTPSVLDTSNADFTINGPPPPDIKIELTWDNTADLDAHFLRPGGTYDIPPGDCYWNNMNPDWGIAGVTTDNPSLNTDDADGYGPEIITLASPYEQGTYTYMVNYYGTNAGTTTATVKIWIRGNLDYDNSSQISWGETRVIADIVWPAGTVNASVPSLKVDKATVGTEKAKQ